MKKILIILICLITSLVLNAQVPCPNDNGFWLDLTPTSQGNTQSSFCTYAGDYNTFTAINGVQYSINVCGGSYNSAVTMYSGAGALLYSQNATAGNGCETFTWTATLSGVVRVLVDRANCGTNSTCTQVDITQLTGGSSPSGNQDCSNKTQVCTDASFTGNSSGFGTQELPNNGTIDGCLTVEHQSSWYIFQAVTSGTVSLIITTAVDYDFAIWGPNVACTGLGSPIRCSFSGLSGNTGLGNAATDLSDGDGTGGNGGLDAWVKPLAVTAGQTYIMLIDNFTSNSTAFTLDWTMSGGATLNCTPLPIELVFFAGENSNNKNILNWLTATETNNKGFNLQRSTNGINWITIAFIEGKGNSTLNNKYTFNDDNYEPTINYYRLEQVDFDGTISYSNLVDINNISDSNKKVINRTNYLGQEVSESYNGTVILHYSDGTYKLISQ